MRNIWIIFKKEFTGYFTSMLAYLIIAGFLGITGWFFSSSLFLINQADLRNVMPLIPLLFMFFIPAITMRTIAEEKKSGTIELLTTMPLRDWEIVIGKYLAALFLMIVYLVFTLPYVMTVSYLGNPDGGQLFSGYMGLVFVGASYTAIGIFTSSITENQIVAFVLALLISFVFFMLNKVLMFVPGFVANIFEYLSIESHYTNISRGVIDSRDLIYYFSLLFMGLYLSTVALESRK